MKLSPQRFFLFLFILFLPSQLARHFWPDFSLISGIPVDYLSPVIYLTDFLALINICLFLPQIRLQKKYILLGLFILANCLFSLSPVLTVYKWLRLGFYFLTGLSLSVAVPKYPRVITAALAGSVIWVSVLAWGQFLHGSSLGGVWTYLGEHPLSTSMPLVAKINSGFGVFLRPYAVFPHPNALAGYLLVSCLLIYFYLIKKLNYQLLLKTGLCIGAFTLPLTFSLPALFLEILFLMLIINKKLGVPKIINLSRRVVPQPLGCGMKRHISDEVRQREKTPTVRSWVLLLILFLIFISLICTLRPSSVNERFYLSLKSLSAIASRPLTGVGLGNFPLYSYPLNNFPLQLSWQPVHNIFLLLAAELGLPAFSFLVYRLSKYFIKKMDPGPWTLVLIAILFTGLFDHYWLTSHQNLLLLLLAPAMLKFHPE